MKKVIATIAGIAVVGASLLSGAGCSSGKLEGTNGAKLLLANERLDEAVFSDTDFWAKGSTGAKTAALSSEAAAASGAASLSKKWTAGAQTVAPTAMTENGEYTYWTDFENYSLTMEDFGGVLLGVENTAKEVAESIGFIKQKVGVTDKWVSGKNLLQVKENEEILYTKYKSGYQVAHRYTRDDAKNTYEIYRYFENDGSGEGHQRTVFIPNEYYEWTDRQSDNITNYFTLENSDGYWKLTRMYENLSGGAGNEYYSFDHYVLKDGLGIGFNYLIKMQNGEAVKDEIMGYHFFDVEEENELFRIEYLSDASTYYVQTFMSNIQSGVSGLRTKTEDVSYSDNMWWVDGSELVLTNGTVDGNGCVRKAGDRYYGWINGSIEAETLAGALAAVEEELASKGITLKTGGTTIAEEAAYTELLGKEFKETFEWNGYKMAQGKPTFNAGKATLSAFFNDSAALYEDVEDNGRAMASSVSYENASLAAIAAASGNATHEQGNVIATDLSLTVGSNALLESGKEYVLKVGLALFDNGAPVSANTVALETASELKVAYGGGDSLSLTQSGEYALPLNLSEGDYVVVAYVATADEGIRVSEMKAVSCLTVGDGAVKSSAMDITVEKSGDTMRVTYAVKTMLEVGLDATKVYTPEEIERILLLAVLANGYPKADATLEETATGYRLRCLLPTVHGLAEAYVYCELP